MHFAPVQLGVYRIGYNALVTPTPLLSVDNQQKKIFCELSAHDQIRMTIVNKFFPSAVELFAKKLNSRSGWEKRTKNDLGGPLRSCGTYRVNLNNCMAEPVPDPEPFPGIVLNIQEPCVGPTSTEDLLMKNDLRFKDMTVEHRAMMLYLARIEGRQFEYRNLASTCRSFVKLMNEPSFSSNYVYRLLPKERPKPKPVVKEHLAQVVCSQLSIPIEFTIKYTSIDGVFQDDAKIVSTTYR